MVGLIMNVDEDSDPVISMEEFEEVYFKFKIYACDDLESIRDDVDDGDDDDNHSRIYRYYDSLRCDTKRVQKCSRLIFVWTFGGRGINFLDGHGIHFNVSCKK